MSDAPGQELSPLSELKAMRMRKARLRYRRDLMDNFQSYLAPVVTCASPLLLDVCAMWGLDLGAMASKLRPPPGWPFQKKGRAAGLPSGTATSARGKNVQLVVMDDTLDVRCWIGDAFVCTGGGELQVWLTDRVSEIVQAGLPGRELSSVVDHPILRMQRYSIIGSRPIGHGTVIGAEAPLVPYALPWA
jgi:hypothetical protein